MRGRPRLRKNKVIHLPNNTAVTINIINTAKKVVYPKLNLTTMLLPYNRKLLPLVGVREGMGMNKNGRRAKVR